MYLRMNMQIFCCYALIIGYLCRIVKIIVHILHDTGKILRL